ncbi:DUF3710 domain-containing protein [Angustibacter peucedani]
MSLFKRRPKDEDVDEVDALDAATDGSDDGGGDDDADDGRSAPAAGDAVTFDRQGGPFDREEVDGPDGRLELGALWLPMVDGIELQLQMDEGTGQVTGAFVVLGDAAVQIQAFAAPRTEGIWREVCDEIAAGITEQGGTADPGYGRFGRELLARVPAQQPDGKVGFQPLRFTGVDGPRWLLRAVFHGRAAVEPENAQVLEDLVAGVVVDRGREPMGPRELLPLHLPKGADVQGDVPAAAVAPGDDPRESIAQDEQARSYDDLAPFRRGPEITERR